MAYNNIWDETFPPDTQLALLLGSDIRNFKTDVRQRVSSFGQGLLSQRPVPEAVFAGVLYYATDTDQLFGWNGGAWVLLRDFNAGGSIPKLYSSLVASPWIAPQTAQSITIPQTGYNPRSSYFKVELDFVDTLGISQILIKLNGSVLDTINSSVKNVSQIYKATFFLENSNIYVSSYLFSAGFLQIPLTTISYSFVASGSLVFEAYGSSGTGNALAFIVEAYK